MRRQEVLRKLGVYRPDLERLGVKSLRLFGSVARDEATTSSDVDLIVEFHSTPTSSGFMRLKIFLEDILGTRVDLITEAGLRSRVRAYVEKDAIRVA